MHARSFIAAAAFLFACVSFANAADSPAQSFEPLWRFDTHG